MKKIKAIIFDMDGVLFDTEKVYMERLNHFMEKDGKHINMAMQMKLLGSSDDEKWRYIDQLYEHKLTRKQFFWMYEKFYQETPFSYRCIMFFEVIETLNALKNKGYTLALASSSIMKEILVALNECDLKDFFSFILSGENCINTKPDPQIYQDTLKALKLSADECIVIEDSEYGITAAKRAGLCVIARKDDYIHVDQSQADFIIHEHHEILTIIEKLEEV